MVVHGLRNGLRLMLLGAVASASLLLGGCGGRSGADMTSAGTVEATHKDQTTNDNFAGTALNLLRVRSASGRAIANHPLQFGRPFVQGEIAGCPVVRLDGAVAEFAQADVKTRHPDGSVRFAVISVVLPSVPTSGEVSISFADGPCADTPGLTKDAMLGAGFDFDARISLNQGTAGVASAREMLSRGHYSLWTRGPVVTTALIADHQGKSYDMGVDAYKSLRPMFEVQFWPGIAKSRVRVILEAADTEKIQNQAYDVTVQTGASSPVNVMSATGVQHNYMSRWTRVFWIGGTPEAVDVDYGLAYLARTQALPNYDASIRLDPEAKAQSIQAWLAAPKGLFDKGLWQPDMPVAGGRPDLGPFPKWMVSWLYDGSAALADVALGQADLAAAWPMHLREGNSSKFTDRAHIHSALGRPVSGYARPTLAFNSLDSGYTSVADKINLVGARSSNGWSPDNAHQPQPFFIPYLLTGEHFYYEQMQFWAGFSLLENTAGYGGTCYSKNVSPEYLGVVGQVRGIAWGFRMLAEAAWAAPDADPGARTWLRDAVEDSVIRFEGTRGVVRGDNASRPDWQWARNIGDCSAGQIAGNNPLRFWHQGNTVYGSNASVARYDATWQYSFLMYSLNRAQELGLPAGALREWFAPFFVGAANRGGLIGYHLADYNIPVLDAQTGTFYQNWDSVHAEYTDYTNQLRWAPASMPNSNSSNDLDQGYATVALTALASTAGLPGSATAWSNFAAPHYAAWGWSVNPKWAILPRGTTTLSNSTGSTSVAGSSDSSGSTSMSSTQTTSQTDTKTVTVDSTTPITTTTASTTATSSSSTASTSNSTSTPAWLASAGVFEWRAVPGSRLDASDAWIGYKGAGGTMGKAGILAYSGGVIRPRGSEFFIAGGGHLDYAGNEIFSIGLGTDAPVWTRRIDPSTITPMNTPHYPDGRPSSRHTYRNLVYSAALERIIFFGGAPWGDTPTYNNLADSFDPTRNEYDSHGLIASAPYLIGGPVGTGVASNGDFYVHHHLNGRLYRWNQSSNTWSDLGYKGGLQYDTPYAVDTRRNRLFRIPWGTYPARIYDLNNDGAFSDVAISGPAAASINTGASMVYDPVVDVFWLWKRNDANLYRIDASTFNASVQPVGGSLPVVADVDARHRIYGRFNYVPELRGLVFMLDQTTNVMFIRTAP